MAEAFGGIGGQVIDVIDSMLTENGVHDRGIADGAFDEFNAGRNVLPKTARQVVDADDIEALSETCISNVRSNEAADAGYE